jgi:hypothetical protein
MQGYRRCISSWKVYATKTCKESIGLLEYVPATLDGKVLLNGLFLRPNISSSLLGDDWTGAEDLLSLFFSLISNNLCPPWKAVDSMRLPIAKRLGVQEE